MVNYKMLRNSALAVGLGVLAYDRVTYGAFAKPWDSPRAIAQKFVEPLDTAVDGFIKPLALYQVPPVESIPKNTTGLIEMAGLGGLIAGLFSRRKKEQSEGSEE